MDTLSEARNPSRKRIAADLARLTRSSMLPEVSRSITAAKGVSSAEKNSIGCSTPSSHTLNCDRLSPGTCRPLASLIAAFNTTMEESTLTSSCSWPYDSENATPNTVNRQKKRKQPDRRLLFRNLKPFMLLQLLNLNSR